MLVEARKIRAKGARKEGKGDDRMKASATFSSYYPLQSVIKRASIRSHPSVYVSKTHVDLRKFAFHVAV